MCQFDQFETYFELCMCGITAANKKQELNTKLLLEIGLFGCEVAYYSNLTI